MALVKSGTFGSSPSAYYEIHADLLGGSGNTRQVKVHLALKVNGSTSSSNYGYPLNWLPKIHTSNGGWQHVKGSERWNATEGLRWYSWTATVDVGTTSSTSIGVGFDLKRSDGGSSSWNTSQSGSFNVGSTNTAPSMNGAVTIRNGSASGSVLTGIIPENVSTLHLSWSAGSDREQGSSGLKYGVNEIVNGGGATTILYPTTGLSHSVNIGAGNEGQRRKYYVDCRDNSDVLSTNRADSVEVTKNSFTGDTLASSSSINFNSSSVAFSYSGAKNTNGNTTFTRVLSCDGITVYNSTLGASPATITVYKSGATPTGAYIKFDDIKNKFKGSNYTGTLTFTLRTTNAYGTARTSTKAISVDLRTNPNAATGQVISTSTTESTMYKKVAFADNYYFLPDGNLVARVKWGAGSGKLGEAISYEIFVAYDSGSWQKVADVASGTLYYNHKIPKQTASQQFKYLVRTKTSYGWYSDAITPTQTLHHYNPPSILVGQIDRAETTAVIPVTIKSSTSIPNVAISGSWSGKGSGDLSTSQTEQKINITDLTGDGTYTITVVYNDNTGFASNQSKAIAVGANLPIMFLNQYGLGVGGSKADAKNALNVNGITTTNGLATKNYVITPKDGIYRTTDNTHTGALTISLPQSWTNTMIDFKIQIYIYGEKQSVEYRVGGYNYNGNNGTWVNTFAYATGNKSSSYKNLNVRFGHNGEKCVVYIGETNTVWSYPQVTIKDVSLGYSGNGPNSWNSGWGISWSTGFGAITSTISNTAVAATTPTDVGAAPASHTHTTVGAYMGISNTTNNNGYGVSLYGGASTGAPSYGLMFQGTATFGKFGQVQGDWATYFTMGGANNRGWIFKSGNGSGGNCASISATGLAQFNTVKVQTPHGNVTIGAQNTSHCHYQTDRSNHWFNKEVRVQGEVLHGSNYDNNYTHGTYWKIQGFDNADKKYLHCATSVGAYGIDWWASDIRLKNNVAELTGKTDYTSKISKDKLDLKRQNNSLSALDTIKKIEHFSFNMLDSDSHTSCGYIADQLQEVNKDFVMEVKQEPTVKNYDKETEEIIDVPNPMYFEEDPVIRNPKPSALIPYITKAIQELVEYNDILKNKNLELENRLALIEKELNL